MAAFKELSATDLDYFVGSSWNSWEKAVKTEGFNKKDSEHEGFSQSTEVARLKKQDSELFGICPGKDEFYLVVCKQCRLPFKPQAFRCHVERHHKQNTLTWPLPKKRKHVQSKKLSAVVSGLPKSQLSSDKTPGALNNSGFNLKKLTNGPERQLDDIGFKTTTIKICNYGSSSQDHDLESSATNMSLQVGLNPTLLEKNLSSLKHNSSATNFSNSKLHSKHELNTQIKYSNLSKTLRKKTDQIKSSDRLQYNKSLKRKLAAENSEIEMKKEFILSDGGSIKTPSNGPIVVIEKSPVAKNLYEDLLKDTKSNSSPLHFRKHYHDPKIDAVEVYDRNATSVPEKMKKIKKEGIKKKILPLKPREYNPNKHCGVWIEEEQMRCTRSLTCKSHSRSIKRTVPDRRKPFDELVVDHAIAKQKLKERAAMLSGKHKYSTSDSVLPGEKNKIPSKDKSGHADMLSPLAPSKLSQKSCSSDYKSRRNINLFTRNLQAKYVDCCEYKEMTTEANFNHRLDFLLHYPKPIAVCNFRSSQLDQRNLLFNFHGNHNQRRFFKSFSVEKESYKLQKHKHFPITKSSPTSLARFASMPSASSVAMETRTRVLQKNGDFCDVTIPNRIPNYANSTYTRQCGRRISYNVVTTSAPECHLPGVKLNTVSSKSFKTSSRVMTQKYAPTSIQTVSSNATDSGSIFVSSPQFNNILSTSESTAIDLNSLFLKGHDQVIQLNQSVLRSKETLVFKNPNDGLKSASINILSGHAPKLKKSLRPKKNCTNDSFNQLIGGKHLNKKVKKSPSRSHPQTSGKNLQRVNSEPLMQTIRTSKDLNRTNSTEGSHASISHKPIKHDIVNGISSSILCSNSWPQYVTLSGGIGALRTTNNTNENEDFNLKNTGYNNNLELPNNIVTMDTLQSLHGNVILSETRNIAETGDRLMNDSNDVAAPGTENHCGELNLSLTPNEFPSLRGVSQGLTLPISAPPDLIMDEALIINNDSVVKLRNS